MASVYHYVCIKKPAEAMALAQKFTTKKIKNGNDALACILYVAKNGELEDVTELLEGIREIHPDRELFETVDRSNLPGEFNIPADLVVKDDMYKVRFTPGKDVDTKLSACGCGGDTKLPATGSDALATEITQLKTETATQKAIKEHMFRAIIIVAVVLLAWKMYQTKKA
jgi:hypothetical protein